MMRTTRLHRRLREIRQSAVGRFDVFRDYLSFRRSYGSFLHQGAELADPEKRALIVSLTDWVAQVKAESVLAKALQLRGYTPVIVTNRSCRWASRYFHVFGYRELVFFDELLARVSPAGVRAEAERMINKITSVSDLLALQYRGVNVGRHVLSYIVRVFRHSDFEFASPQNVRLLRQFLPEALRAVSAAEALVDRVKPRIALFLEKGYPPHGELFDVLLERRVNTIQWVHSHRADAFALKRYTQATRDVHPFSVSRDSWSVIREMPWTRECDAELMQELRGRYLEGTWFSRKFLQVGKQLKSEEEVRRQLSLDPAKKTAVIFSHVLWDATFFYGENLFSDYEEWLVETVKAACDNHRVNWVIKFHPDYVWKLRQAGLGGEIRDAIAIRSKVGRLPDHVRVLEPGTDIDTFSLFGVCDYCVTVRGTIGIEMPCFGIPVFTAGTGRYSGLGFTVDSSTREEYLNRLGEIDKFPRLGPEEIELARKHAYALFKLRPCEFRTFEMVQLPFERLGHPLDHNVVIRARSYADLAAAPDLKRFAEWAAESEELDYLTGVGAAGIPPG